MTPSEIKSKKGELHRVIGTRFENEAKIEQLQENIARLSATIVELDAAIEKIEKVIADAEGAKA